MAIDWFQLSRKEERTPWSPVGPIFRVPVDYSGQYWHTNSIDWKPAYPHGHFTAVSPYWDGWYFPVECGCTQLRWARCEIIAQLGGRWYLDIFVTLWCEGLALQMILVIDLKVESWLKPRSMSWRPGPCRVKTQGYSSREDLRKWILVGRLAKFRF